MVMPPPNVAEPGYDPQKPPLRQSAFTFTGHSVNFLGPFTVHDETADAPCEVTVETDVKRVVSERWADHPDPPPGSVQYRGRVEVRFEPAVPGHVYRVDCGRGSVWARYDPGACGDDAADGQ